MIVKNYYLVVKGKRVSQKEHPFFFIEMFISFAPPKEMNQRKGGRKRQPVPLAALRVGTGSHLFRFANAHSKRLGC
jgi:hypothetical protein